MTDLTANLSHAVPDMKRRHLFLRAKVETDPPDQTNQNINVETVIHDGRCHELKLDEASFELVNHPTALTTDDFYDAPEKVTSAYYDEMKELFQAMTGCAHVVMFHHQVRNNDRSNGGLAKDGSFNTNTTVQGYAHGIHSDSSSVHAEDLFKNMVRKVPDECRQGRFLYINAWRNIADHPIVNDHLAVLDERTLVKPDDYIQTDLHGVGYDVLQYNLNARNAGRHRWYYFPQMTKDEVLVFKQWDSDPERLGRLCFHTAIHDSNAPTSAPCRQSIEARGFLFFPDHSPNTCPRLPSSISATSDGSCDEALVQTAFPSLKGAIAYIANDTKIRSLIILHLKSVYMEKGAAGILAVLADDEKGYHGLTQANAVTKGRVVELLLEAGCALDVDKWFCGPSPAALAWASLSQSRMAAGVVGAVVALTARKLLR